MPAAGAISTRFTGNPLICIPRIALACWKASSGVLASLTPPALPRPPAFTWALTTTTPSSSAAVRASSGVVATIPRVTGTPCLAKSSFAWYSIRSTIYLRESPGPGSALSPCEPVHVPGRPRDEPSGTLVPRGHLRPSRGPGDLGTGKRDQVAVGRRLYRRV